MLGAVAGAIAVVVVAAVLRARTVVSPRFGLIASCTTVVVYLAPLLMAGPSFAIEHAATAAGDSGIVSAWSHQNSDSSVDPGSAGVLPSARRAYDRVATRADEAGALSAPVSEVSATRAGGGTDVFHATTSPGAAQGVANGINPARLNPNSRFGRAFYAAESPDTGPGVVFGAMLIPWGLVGALIGLTKRRVLLGLALGCSLGCIGWLLMWFVPVREPNIAPGGRSSRTASKPPVGAPGISC